MGEALKADLRGALVEVMHYGDRGCLFWWRRASMAKLADLGMVETYRPPSLANSKRKTLPYRITQAGRQVLAAPPPSRDGAGPGTSEEEHTHG